MLGNLTARMRPSSPLIIIAMRILLRAGSPGWNPVDTLLYHDRDRLVVRTLYNGV